jgi:hypothetical protein
VVADVGGALLCTDHHVLLPGEKAGETLGRHLVGGGAVRVNAEDLLNVRPLHEHVVELEKLLLAQYLHKIYIILNRIADPVLYDPMIQDRKKCRARMRDLGRTSRIFF